MHVGQYEFLSTISDIRRKNRFRVGAFAFRAVLLAIFALSTNTCASKLSDLPDAVSAPSVSNPVSICTVINDPHPTDTAFQLWQTTVIGFGKKLVAGDESCVTGHFLVDVVFEQEAVDLLCATDKKNYSTACELLRSPSDERTSEGFALKGVFAGRMDVFSSNEAFTHAGKRFRLTIHAIEFLQNVDEHVISKPK